MRAKRGRGLGRLGARRLTCACGKQLYTPRGSEHGRVSCDACLRRIADGLPPELRAYRKGPRLNPADELARERQAMAEFDKKKPGATVMVALRLIQEWGR